MTIYFTSDTHFNHKRILEYCDRPFDTVSDMNEALIKEWNNTVTDEDIIYHLGDFTFKEHVSFLSRLNGQKHLILGNHDVRKHAFNADWLSVQDILQFTDPEGDVFVLCHYPMRVWNRSSKGSYHLYGHSHGDLDKSIKWGRSMDVGVDNAYRLFGEYRPFEISQIKSLLHDRDLLNHHF